ncbi:hypothetical protein SSX86_003321 [Deinandra increscens subsp. villosa]|uniref:TFIIS N-terminal domain-containing protein n=1 Tax=Deinandra increscens subsp. villosa TaxID=3103831 RepID=A0AAP0DLS2_9ASTR
MDLDEFREILSNSRLDVWGIIDAAITVASSDYSGELKDRRDGIVQRLYALKQCSNCDVNVIPPELPNDGVRSAAKEVSKGDGGDSPLTPQSIPQDDEEEDDYGLLYDEEQSAINRIKEQLEDPHQTEDSVIELLQTLADMDLTFKGLKETDIGRHVNRLRKHSSSEVRSLVKHLVRKWKDLVDDWVGSNHTDHQHSSPTDGDSPLMQNVPRKAQNYNQQASDSGYSPNPHNWSPAPERINREQEQRAKGVAPKRETVSRPISQPRPVMTASAARNQPRKEESIDLDRLASARKRLHENYQEAQNAKTQRKIQVMDIHEIPKPKNGFISKNKGNFQGRNHR